MCFVFRKYVFVFRKCWSLSSWLDLSDKSSCIIVEIKGQNRIFLGYDLVATMWTALVALFPGAKSLRLPLLDPTSAAHDFGDPQLLRLKHYVQRCVWRDLASTLPRQEKSCATKCVKNRSYNFNSSVSTRATARAELARRAAQLTVCGTAEQQASQLSRCIT